MTPNPDLCPNDIVWSLTEYEVRGVPPGGFLCAVLENNLVEAFKRADNTNIDLLPHIVAWVYDRLPSNIWGSTVAVQAHLMGFRKSERDEPVMYERGELPARDCRDEHDKTL